jgi:hypothetical protein
MSSNYYVCCVSHDPAIIAADKSTPEEAVEAIADGIDGHGDCDLLIVRVSGAPVEVGCPPTRVQHPDRTVCLGHGGTAWADVDVLQLLHIARNLEHAGARKAAAAHCFRHWTPGRLHSLRYQLDLT